MKRTILFFTVLLFSGGVFAQGSLYQPLRYYPTSTQGALLYNRTFSGPSNDTIKVPLGNIGSLIVSLEAMDTTSILVSYATSYNDTNYTTFATVDSLKLQASGNLAKNFDFTPYIQGRNFIKINFLASASAYALGVVNPIYTATVEKISQPVVQAVNTVSYPIVTSIAKQAQQTITITRPATNITYTATYAVQNGSSTFKVFSNVVSAAGGAGTIQTALMTIDTANTTGGTFNLYVFSDTTGLYGVPVADNVAQPFTAAALNKLAGVIGFTLATGGVGSTAAYSYVSPALRFTTTTYPNLYVLLTATGAYHPDNSGNIKLTLNITQ